MIHDNRIDLTVPYAEKEDAKALGARWDNQKKVWYAPPGTNLGVLNRWLPKEVAKLESPAPESVPDAVTVKGIALRDLLARVKGVVERGLPEAVWVRAEINELRSKSGATRVQADEKRGSARRDHRRQHGESGRVGDTAKVGPTIARRIIAGRPYRTVDDLRRVKGIGEKRQEEFRRFVAAR